MSTASGYTFHIPVNGLACTINTLVKTARYGISSVISIVDDILFGGLMCYTQLGSDPTTAHKFDISFSQLLSNERLFRLTFPDNPNS